MKAWKDLKATLKEQGKEDKYLDDTTVDFDGLVQAAQAAQKEFSERKGSKAKNYFNKFCERAWAHKVVLECLPSSNEYVAVFCGSIKTLVQVSSSHHQLTPA